MTVVSLNELEREVTRHDTLATVQCATLGCLRGILLALPVALALVAALLVIPTVAIPSLEMLALVVSTWSLLALFSAAVLATGPR